MKIDLVIDKEHRLDDLREEVLFVYNGLREAYKQNILDENGESLSWYYHDVFKPITKLYWDNEKQRFWLPKSELYCLDKLKELYNRTEYNGSKTIDNLAFFNKAYFLDLLGIDHNLKHGVNGLFK